MFLVCYDIDIDQCFYTGILVSIMICYIFVS